MLFPAGLDAAEVKVLCGVDASKYNFGSCTVGWAYILVIIGTVVGAVAACMSWTTYKWREKDDEVRSYHV